MSRVAVVTGGAAGMGLAISQRLADDGHAVAVFDIDGDAAAQAAEGYALAARRRSGSRSTSAIAARWKRPFAQVRAELGPIGIMVTSAGVDRFEQFTEISIESWDRMIAVNLTGTFHCLQCAVPDMVEAGWGRIVTISSSSAQSGARRMAHYVASKGGVIGLTKALALDFAANGITVNTIPPGFIDTPMARRAEQRGDLPSIAAVAAQTPVRRAGTPGRHRRGVRVPLLRGSRLHHRPADQRERRLVSVTGDEPAPRLAPLPREQWDDDVRSALRKAFPDAVVQRFASTEPDAPPAPNVLATMVHHPALAGPWLAYNNVLLSTPALGHRMRELIVLRVAWRTQSPYEWAQHVMLAPRFGITDDDIDAIAREGAVEVWTPVGARSSRPPIN